MAGDQYPEPSRDDDVSSGAGQGWTAVAYLIGGIFVWGMVGWFIDKWLDTRGIATGIGAIVGAAGGVYLIVRRLGA